jgi:hypothetical protein
MGQHSRIEYWRNIDRSCLVWTKAAWIKFDYAPEKEELVTELMVIAREELEHLQMVHDLIKSKGLALGRNGKIIMWMNYLIHEKDGSRNDALCERLLFQRWLKPEVVNDLKYYLKILQMKR